MIIIITVVVVRSVLYFSYASANAMYKKKKTYGQYIVAFLSDIYQVAYLSVKEKRERSMSNSCFDCIFKLNSRLFWLFFRSYILFFCSFYCAW
jgi:hypothetical protein